MWIRQAILGTIGLGSGIVVAGGLFSFIVSLGVVSDFADRTHTGKQVLLYEEMIVVGGILGNIFSIYKTPLPGNAILFTVIGLFAGIFVGCWAMALAEILNVFPIFIRRAKVLKYIPYIILCLAIGKGVGAFVFLINGW